MDYGILFSREIKKGEKVMSRTRTVVLSEQQQAELLKVRDRDPLAYKRTKAAAVLKVAQGQMIKQVALEGLNRPHSEETVSRWITIYETEGIEGWKVQAGRGRKPAFSPSAPGYQHRRRSPGRSLPQPPVL